jgi:hypothetical protein
MKHLLSFLLLAALAVTTARGDDTVKLAPSMLKVPQIIGPLRYAGETRYDRRLGRSFAYNASGISLNVFVFDYGFRNLADGPDSVEACEQYQSARSEIESGGNYENVILRSEVSRPLRADRPSPIAREAVYEFERNGMRTLSVLWLTAADGFFIKLRMSMRVEIGDELDDAREQILDAIAAAIEARPPRPPRALPADPALSDSALSEPSIEMTQANSVFDTPAWFAYALELSRYVRENPGAGPPCGGVLDPPFELEIEGRRAALREYRARPVHGRRSSYFNALARVEDAGFLEEYVWHYLHRDAWGAAPPAALTMGAFEEYRERELSSHMVQSGARVRIHAVRALPPAPYVTLKK